jgi:hypothetical protein
MARWKDIQSIGSGVGLLRPGTRLLFIRGCMIGRTGTITEAHDRYDGRDGVELTVALSNPNAEEVMFNVEHEPVECYRTVEVIT